MKLADELGELNGSDNASLNDLYELYGFDDTSSTTSNIVLIVLYIPVFLVALFGNLLILIVILCDTRSAKSSANYFLGNLALADLFVAIVCIPMTSVNYVFNVWILGTTLCKVTAYMQGVSIVSSVLTITLMSIDRFFAIRYPMKNRQIFTSGRVRRLVATTWMTAGILVMPVSLVSKVVSPEFGLGNDYCTEIWPSHVTRQIYDVTFLVLFYLVPGGAIVVLYTLMGFRLWAKDVSLQRQNSCHKDEVLIVRRRVATMMIIISVLFAACWLPYYIFNICLDFEVDTAKKLINLYPFAILLGHSNSAQNPILYCFMHKGFKKFLLRIVKCQCRKITWRKNQAIKAGQLNRSTRTTSYRAMGRKCSKQWDLIVCKNINGGLGSSRKIGGNLSECSQV